MESCRASAWDLIVQSVFRKRWSDGVGGKPGLLFFTSEICSLQASFPLQMQQQKGALPCLPSPYTRPAELQSCTATLDYFFFSSPSLHTIHFPLSTRAALSQRARASSDTRWLLNTRTHTAIRDGARHRTERHLCSQTWVPLLGVLGEKQKF